MKNSKLRVHYGWARINKIRKREAISVIFENDKQVEERTHRFIKRMQDTVYIRYQTDGEALDAAGAIRMYTEFNIFMGHKNIKGSLDAALLENFRADSKNVSNKILEEIRDELHRAYILAHPHYKEPRNHQLDIEFQD